MKRDLFVTIPTDDGVIYEKEEHRQYRFTSMGQIIYDPYRGKMKNSKNWCVVQCDDGISDYYRWWIEKRYGFKLLAPDWGAHISLVRGERISKDKMTLWKKYHKKKIIFKYTHDVFTNGDFFWINVFAEELSPLRRELGLVTGWGFHLTVARIPK